MKVFLGGIIQGSHAGTELHDQEYRDEIKRIIRARVPAASLICPVDRHPNSIAYGPDEARHTFFSMVAEAEKADVVIAYLPEASMGTAIEMWQAHRAGRPVIAITPMRHNWVVNLLSTIVFPTLGEFRAFVEQGGLERLATAGKE